VPGAVFGKLFHPGRDALKKPASVNAGGSARSALEIRRMRQSKRSLSISPTSAAVEHSPRVTGVGKCLHEAKHPQGACTCLTKPPQTVPSAMIGRSCAQSRFPRSPPITELQSWTQHPHLGDWIEDASCCCPDVLASSTSGISRGCRARVIIMIARGRQCCRQQQEGVLGGPQEGRDDECHPQEVYPHCLHQVSVLRCCWQQ